MINPIPAQGLISKALSSNPSKTQSSAQPSTPTAQYAPVVANNGQGSVPNLGSATSTGITLSGITGSQNKYFKAQQAIANKYANVYKSGINVQLVNGIKNAPYTLGQTQFNSPTNRTIQIDYRTSPAEFEHTMLHEIGHRIFNYSEDSADKYGYEIQKMVNNQK